MAICLCTPSRIKSARSVTAVLVRPTKNTRASMLMARRDPLLVFQYWGQGVARMPAFIRTVYDHNLEFCKKHNLKLVLMDDENVHDYITPHPRFPTLGYAHKSDLVRYYALHKYGGFWFDCDVILVRDLNELYDSLSGQQCMVDIEFGDVVGSASLFLRKESPASAFCLRFVNSVLNQNRHLGWDIFVYAVRELCRRHRRSVFINDYETVRTGCNFICWNTDPGFNKSGWYMESESAAESRAAFLKKNDRCHYLITWTIYRRNDMGERLNDMVFNDKRSVFSYFVNCEKGEDSA